MRKTYCDQCGKEIRDYKRVERHISLEGHGTKVRVGIELYFYSQGDLHFSPDLCIDCRLEIINRIIGT